MHVPTLFGQVRNELTRSRRRWTWGTTTLRLDKKTYVDIVEICKEETVRLAGVNGATMVLLPQPISKTMIEASQQTMGNTMGLRSVAQLCR